MRQPKKKYQVYTSYEFISDIWEDCHRDDWVHAGECWAVSKKQAVNFVRHRIYGNEISQHGYYEYGDCYYSILHFFAVEAEDPILVDVLPKVVYDNNSKLI